MNERVSERTKERTKVTFIL